MNKSSVMLVLVLGLLVFSGFVLAADNVTVNTSASTTTTLNGSKLDNAFSCLTTQVKPDCTGTNKVQDIALTILASPSGVTQKCYDRLTTTFKKGNCFGDSTCTVKDTALAILAINHVGQDTKNYESWLKNQTKVAEELIWYLEQDSVEKAGCKISYNSVDYSFNVLENKKIDSAAGTCLSLANSNYWFQVTPACYNTKFTIVCDKSYIATLLYKQPTSSTLYVLSDTKSAQTGQPIELTVKSLCFGEGACNYESSAWAAIALDKTGNSIEDYIPYLIAGEEANQKYLPAAFLQILKDFSEYGTKLIQQQKINNWEAENTAYNKFYDTGLALLALSTNNQQKVTDAKSWLLNLVQDANGCWNNNNIRDTAMILWAIEGRRTTVTGAIATLADCEDASFFCIASDKCPTEELLPNYNCNALGKKCCKTENLESCEAMEGQECASGKECTGSEQRASDTAKCCLTECETLVQQNECQIADGICRSTCLSGENSVSLGCDTSAQVCCNRSSTPAGSTSYTWLWIILVLLIILVVLAIVFREKLKVWIYKMKSGFKEDKGKSNTIRPGGFPPAAGPYSSEKPMQQRPPMRPMPVRPLQPTPVRRPLAPQTTTLPPLRR